MTWLYIAPDQGAQKVDRVQPGREMVIAEKSGPWIRVYANTDMQEVDEKDAPLIGHRRILRLLFQAGWRPAAWWSRRHRTATRC